jgi:hypothetical protein
MTLDYDKYEKKMSNFMLKWNLLKEKNYRVNINQYWWIIWMMMTYI